MRQKLGGQSTFLTRVSGLALAVFLVSIIGGCSEETSMAERGNTTDTKTDTKTDTTVAVDFSKAIIGSWKTGCKTLTGLYFDETLTFQTGNKVSINYARFQDVKCTVPQETLVFSGTFKLGASSTKVTGAQNLDFSYTSASATPQSDAEVKSKNDKKYCAKTWVKDKAITDLVGKDCNADGVVDFPVSQYFIVKLLETKLYIGDGTKSSNTGSSAAKRTDRLITTYYYKKQ